jgi:hypothetical protein
MQEADPRLSGLDQPGEPGKLRRRLDGSSKQMWREGVVPVLLALEALDDPGQFRGERSQIPGRRRIAGCAEAVKDAGEDAILASFMNVGIVAVQVAERYLESKALLLEDEEPVIGMLGRTDQREPALEELLRAARSLTGSMDSER